MATLNIILPAYNEEENIKDAILTLQTISTSISIPFKVIVINDNSTDKTKDITDELKREYFNITLINRRGNHGLGRCINRGFEELSDGYVVIFMADLADDVNDIPKMLKEIEKGADLVCASRYKKGGKANHYLKIKGFLSRFLGFTLKLFTGISTNDATNAFKMYRTSVLDEIGILKTDNYASGLEVLVKAYCHGFKISEIPTVWQDRSFGSSNFKIIKAAPEYIHWFFWAVKKVWFYRLFGKKHLH